ncbi:retrovirus-related pol polyprotein from transposon TNT 1-94 [Tanacetum coccineum]
MMLERFTQPNVDPLALMSNVSHQSSINPSSTYVPPHFADNSQLDSGLSPMDNLIENLTNTLSLLTQSYKTYLPQTNNQLRTSSNPRNQATVQDGMVVVKCYNCNDIGHMARNCTQPKRPQNSEYFTKRELHLLGSLKGEGVLNKPRNVILPRKIFEELEAEVDQNVVHRKHAEIERKNLLIANDNLIADCLSKDVFYITTNSELTVSRFTEMHDAHTVVQARCLELEAELSKLQLKIQTDDHNELVNRFSNLEVNHLNLQLKYQNLKESFGNNPPPPARETPDFDSVFVIEKMKASLQGKDNVIKKLKMQISQLKEPRSEANRALDFRTLDFQIT